VFKKSVMANCPVCLRLEDVDVFLACSIGNFFECKLCDFIFFFNDDATSSSVRNSINYEATYWAEELLSAKT
jgi:hypothetical protein